ncbi:MAG: sulfatase, partial [Phycisphaerae bacterium]
KAYYYAMISFVDDCVGRLVGELRKLGLAENTCIIFTSDHGEFLGDYGLLGKGERHYDCIVRVPLVIWCPSRFGPRTVQRVVETVDLLPTICELAGVQRPAGAQGWSLVGLMEGGQWQGPDDALIEGEWEQDGDRRSNRTLRTARYRLSCYSHAESGELYDLQEDPRELNNLWAEPAYRDLREQLTLRLMQRMMQSDDPLPARIAPY